jgi:hypothetical protein
MKNKINIKSIKQIKIFEEHSPCAHCRIFFMSSLPDNDEKSPRRSFRPPVRPSLPVGWLVRPSARPSVQPFVQASVRTPAGPVKEDRGVNGPHMRASGNDSATLSLTPTRARAIHHRHHHHHHHQALSPQPAITTISLPTPN